MDYVPYIKDEKVKIQQFLELLPTYFQDIIEFDSTNALEASFHKERICYEHNQHRTKPKREEVKD